MLGLIDGCYDDKILTTIAKFSSDISGDIRFSLKLFERVASYAEIDKCKKIPEFMVEEVINELENSEFDKKLISLNRHQKICLLAISLESSKNPYGYAITYPDSYNTYVLQAKTQGVIPTGDRRFRDYLNELQMLDFLSLQNKSTNKRGGRLRIAVPNFDFHKLLNKMNIRKEVIIE